MPRTVPRLPESTRAAFITAARGCVGTRWRHQGRSMDRGLDCIGLVICAMREVGIEVEDVSGYAREPDGSSLRAGIVARLGEPTRNWKPGDIALMRWQTKVGIDSHVGILATHNGEWTLLHAYLKEKRVVEHRLAAEWPGRVSEVFSLTGAP